MPDVLMISVAILMIFPMAYYLVPAIYIILGFKSLIFYRPLVDGRKSLYAFSLGSLALVVVNSMVLYLHGEPASHYGHLLPFLIAPLILIGLLAKPISRESLVIGAILASFGAAAIALFEFVQFGIDHRVSGFFRNPISFGGLSLFFGTICGMAYIFLCRRKRLGIFTLLGFGAGVYACIMSGSRGSWIGLLVVAPALYIADKYSASKPVAQERGMALIYIGVIVALLTLTTHPRFQGIFIYFSSVSAERLEDGSIAPRLAIYRHALDKLSAKELLWGISRRELADAQVQEFGSKFPGGYPTPARHLHSDYLEILVHRGIVGVAFFIIFLIICIKIFWSALRTANNFSQFAGFTGLVLIAETGSFALTTTWLFHGARMAITSFLILVLLAACVQSQQSGHKSKGVEK